MAIVENTLSSIYDQLLYLSGQNTTSIKIADAVRLFNFAINDYTYLAITSDGKWKSGDLNATGPNSYSTTIDGSERYKFQPDFLFLNRVEYTSTEGKVTVLQPLAYSDEKDVSLDDAHPGSTPTHYLKDGSNVTLYPNPSAGTLTVYPSLPFGQFSTTTLSQEIGIPSIHAGYLVWNAMNQIITRFADAMMTKIEREMFKWEGDGNRGGKIREYYSKRDEDRPRQLEGKVNVID